MRLTQIKLAGFKSFVDPTVIPVPGRLVGVVGPNGCGKSNIIDAVRWVMGESRASELRGESMQDVIFNGSGERKRAARASVELAFDNSSGRVGGQWGAYAELSVRRVLTRDGASTYFINNQTVRRRDVHDLFLGTGLGTRGYAIIGQGMINRLIEARPQELRIYLEEAAGVSRYKERRRETENRLRDTRDNLVRLEDILQELDTQLERLEKQAGQARQYREFQARFNDKQQLLWLVQESAAREQQKSAFAAIEQTQLQLEAAKTSQRSNEARIERVRQAHQAGATALHDAQGVLYQVGADISRLEAEQRHLMATQERLQGRRQQLQQQQAQWQEQIAHCDAQLEDLEVEHDMLLAQKEEQAYRLETELDQLPELEARMAAATDQREALRADLARLDQRLALVEQAAANAQRQQDRLTSRQERLAEEARALPVSDPHELEQAERTLDDLQQQTQDSARQRDSQEAALAEAETRLNACVQARQQADANQSALQARHQALAALQQQVEKPQDLQAWLTDHGLADVAPLWQSLRVAEGWETAIEAVLEERMAAIAVSRLADWTTPELAPTSRATLYQLPQGTAAAHPPAANVLPNASPLSAQVSADEPVSLLLRDWLAGMYTCPDLATALALQPDLKSGETLIVPAGHRIDRHGIRFFADHSEQTGVLARQAEIRRLHDEVETASARAADSHEAEQAARQTHDEARAVLAQGRAQLDDLTRRQHEQTVHVHTLRQRHEQRQQMRTRLQHEKGELDDELIALRRQVEEAAAESRLLHDERDAHQQEYDTRARAAEAVSEGLDAHRARVQEQTLQQQQLEHQVHAIQSRIDEHRRNRQLAHDEFSRAQTELQALQGELFDLDETDVREQLQAALAARVQAEKEVEAARHQHDNLAETLRETEEARMQDVARLEPLQERIVALQLEEQAARLAVEQHAEALSQAQANRRHLEQQRQQLPAHEQEPGRLQTEVQQLKRRMQSMGDVNLAALQELETANQRKAFLDSQYEDLHDAVSTLEDAI
ncbi:MAG TPA: chromosome segregation protein SMC, partial [Burkholderiaceae bacterium]|nr:chromosome segregation protein SMC [Burkholderiaceae bacterium]